MKQFRVKQKRFVNFLQYAHATIEGYPTFSDSNGFRNEILIVMAWPSKIKLVLMS